MSGPKGQSTERKGKSFLTVEWTNQHGCGDDDLNCNIVLQYMCQPQKDIRDRDSLRNGMYCIIMIYIHAGNNKSRDFAVAKITDSKGNDSVTPPPPPPSSMLRICLRKGC